MPKTPVTVVIVYQARPGKAGAGLDSLSALVRTVVAEEPACLGITVSQDLSDPTRILLWEEWVDKASYVGPHMETPHIQAFIRSAPETFAGPPDISFWEKRAEARSA